MGRISVSHDVMYGIPYTQFRETHYCITALQRIFDTH